MKRAMCCLIAGILIVLLSTPAIPGADPPEEIQSLLIAQPHPELSGLNALQITIVQSGANTPDQDAFWSELARKVNASLENAGIDVAGRGPAAQSINPEMRIYIDTLKLADAEQSIFLVRTSLAEAVYLTLGKAGFKYFRPGPLVKADVWTRASGMRIAASQDAHSKITEAVLGQTKAFVANWTAANPPDKEAPNAAEVAVIQEMPTEQPAESTSGEYQYVASKNSQVFHLADCRSVGRISAKNITRYRSRTEAVNAGKRPCKLCKP